MSTIIRAACKINGINETIFKAAAKETSEKLGMNFRESTRRVDLNGKSQDVHFVWEAGGEKLEHGRDNMHNEKQCDEVVKSVEQRYIATIATAAA